jgi:enoyl-CoA hydratase/carnithine racemase
METLLVEKQDRVLLITLNRPEAGNAFNTTMVEEITRVWREFVADDDLWIAVITGAGDRFFCTGIDLKEASSVGVTRTGDIWLPVSRMMHDTWKPIICAVNGVCCGGGLHFVCDADIVIASENAQFFDPHVNVGYISGWEAVGLARRIPLAYVFRMTMCGRSYRLSAQDAWRIGLVTEVVPQAELLPYALGLAHQMARECAPLAVRGTKEAIKRGLDMGLRDALELSADIIKKVWGTEDMEEGARAFVERRAPQWKGR